METARKCPPLDALEQFVAGQRDDPALAAHLRECPQCAAHAVEARANNALLAVLRPRTILPPGASDLAAPASEAARFPGFEILGTMHRGGQGIVYRARHVATKRTVALKVPLGSPAAGTRQAQRFEREIELVARLRHPQIVTLYESGRTAAGSDLYFAMEYVDGVPVDQYVRARLPSPAEGRGPRITRVLTLFLQICDAVQHAHERGVIHRDLKPGNILVDEAGTPHVLDFGVAKLLAQENAADLTHSAEFIGTFAYAAPEQVLGDPDRIDTRSDVYALGVLLYELLTGRMPYETSGAIGDVVQRIAATIPPPPSTHVSAIDNELDTIVLKALEKDADRRYFSAGALALDLNRYLRHEPIDAKRDSTWYLLQKTLKRYRLPFALLAGALAVLVLFAAFMTVAYRRAAVAEHAVAREAERLSAALADSTIDRGRLLAAAGNVSAAERLLWPEFLGQPPGSRLHRQARWALWELYSLNPCLASLPGPARGAWSPTFTGGQLPLRTFSPDGSVTVWDAVGPPTIVPPALGGGSSGPYVIGPDDRRLVRNAARTRYFDIRPGRAPVSIDAIDAGFSVAALSPEGDCIALGDETGSIYLLDGQTHVLRRRWSGHQAQVAGLAFSRDGCRLFSCGYDLQLCTWSTRDGAPLGSRTIAPLSPRMQVGNLVTSADGCRLALSMNWQIFVYDAGTLEPQRTLAGALGAIQALAFGPHGRWLASAGFDKRILLWDVERGEARAAFAGHTGASTGLTFNADGTLLASASADGIVRLWDTAITTGRPPGLAMCVHMPTAIQWATYTPDGAEILAATEDAGLVALDAQTGEIIRRYRGHTDVAFAIAGLPDGKRFVTCANDGSLRLWSRDAELPLITRSLRTVAVYPDSHEFGPRYAPQTLAVDPNGTTVAVGGSDGEIALFDTAALQLQGTIAAHGHRITSLCFSPAGTELVSGGMDEYVTVSDPRRHTVLKRWRAHAGGVRSLDISADGTRLATGGDDALLRIWSLPDGAPLGVCAGHAQDVFAVQFSPDGTLLASGERGEVGDAGSLIILWDSETGRALARLRGHSGMVFSLDFSSDGRMLLSSSRDQLLLAHDLGYFDRHIAGNRPAFERVEEISPAPPLALPDAGEPHISPDLEDFSGSAADGPP